MTDNRKFMNDYSRGMEMLRLGGRAFANLATGLGYPIADETIPTAQVQLNMDEERIEFLINPNFISELKDSDIAAVIAHETYHVILNHLGEMADLVTFPKRPILIDAQECIINDTLPSSVGFETTDGTYKGMERHNQDFSNFTSQEGYDFILNKQQEEEEKKEEGANDPDEKKEKSDDSNSDGSDSGASKSDSDQDESDSEKSDSGSSEGSPSDNEDSEASDGSGSGEPQDGEADSEGSGGGSGQAGEPAEGCHGVAIVGENADDAQAVADTLGKAISKAMDNVDTDALPADIQEALEDLSESGVDVPQPGFSLGQAKDSFKTIDPYSDLNVNWLQLLQEINPKMKTAGKPKFKDSWHTPRRRMLHSYPDVILPTRVRLDDPNKKKGDSVPSFVIALDMSGSIPERLLGTLAAFARSIPDKLIKSFPITWSDGHKIFNPERPREMVSRGGTTISTVMDYVRKVEKETGTKPYVLVITDGQYSIPYGWDKKEIMEKWYWMGIQSSDVQSIMHTTGAWTTKERVFDLNKFI